MTKHDFIRDTRKLLQEDALEKAISNIESFLIENQINDKQAFDSLIVVSSSVRRVGTSFNLGKVTYEDFVRERNKATVALTSLINDISTLKINYQDAENEVPSRALVYLEKKQNEEINLLTNQMIRSDNYIIQLSLEVREKEKQILSLSYESEITLLKQQILYLQEQIQKEEDKYSKLHTSYEELQNERLHTDELRQTIDYYKQKLAVKEEHIEILSQNEKWNKVIIEELKSIINSLKSTS